MLSKVVSSSIFKVFGMTRPGIEPRSPGPLANTLTAGPIGFVNILLITFLNEPELIFFCSFRKATSLEKGKLYSTSKLILRHILLVLKGLNQYILCKLNRFGFKIHRSLDYKKNLKKVVGGYSWTTMKTQTLV